MRIPSVPTMVVNVVGFCLRLLSFVCLGFIVVVFLFVCFFGGFFLGGGEGGGGGGGNA